MGNNKTGKYLKYAVGEIALVVIGILIALSINNWNEERKNAKKEVYYLNSIETSIQLSQKELNRVIYDAEQISSCAETLFLRLAQNPDTLPDGILLDSLLFNSTDYSIMSLNDGGIQEILNTGSLDIIKSEEIRVQLASWNERMHQIRKFEGETEYIARDFQEYLMPFTDIKRGYNDSLMSIIIPEKKQRLLTDPYLTNYLAIIMRAHRGMHEMYTEEKTVLDSLSLSINEYLLQ
jgi:hypothetical protein